MGDVIFKGNGRRPPMSFAEVTLVFDNEEQILDTDTPEVAITRRLWRSGDSEYLLNRRPARLKDIRELFFDTGLGQNAYAVLEQGRIDGILRANAEERRAIFEEAAGVQRFRMRKREASRKLDKVDQNLLRVADLIEELEKRVRSLRIQAGRARSYVELTSKLTELKTMQFLAAGAEMAGRVETLAQQLRAAREADKGSEEALAEATAMVSQVESEFQALRDDLGNKRTRAAQLHAEREAGEERMASLKQREAESNRAIEERDRRVEGLHRDLEERRAVVAAQRGRIDEMTGELEAAQRRVDELTAALSRAQDEDARRRASIEEVDEAIVRLSEAELHPLQRARRARVRAAAGCCRRASGWCGVSPSSPDCSSGCMTTRRACGATSTGSASRRRSRGSRSPTRASGCPSAATVRRRSAARSAPAGPRWRPRSRVVTRSTR